MEKEDKPIKITILVTPTDVKVTFSDWLKLNPTKLARIHEKTMKAWRCERAKVVHADRVKKAKEARDAEQDPVKV